MSSAACFGRPPSQGDTGVPEPRQAAITYNSFSSAHAAKKAPEGPEIEVARRKRLLEKAGVPKRYASKVTPNHEYDSLLEEGIGLYIVGERGCGKTHLAWEVVIGYLEWSMRRNEIADSWAFSKSARLVVTNDLLEEITSTYDGEGSASAVLDRYAGYDLLVLDDFGKEVPTEWARAKIFQLVNRRYNDRKATVVTTQYEPARLVERLGRRGGLDDAEAIMSRLREMCVQVALRGGDRRRLPQGAAGSDA